MRELMHVTELPYQLTSGAFFKAQSKTELEPSVYRILSVYHHEDSLCPDSIRLWSYTEECYLDVDPEWFAQHRIYFRPELAWLETVTPYGISPRPKLVRMELQSA